MSETNQKPKRSNNNPQPVQNKPSCPFKGIAPSGKVMQRIHYALGRIKFFIKFLHDPKHIFPRARVHYQPTEYPSLENENEIIELLKTKNRPYLLSFAFRLIMGATFL